MSDNKGARLLREWLTEHNRTQEWLAQELATRQVSVSAWCRGRVPTVASALRIKRVTGIAVESWGEQDRPPRPSRPPRHAA